MKQTVIWFNLQIDGTGNGLSNIKDTFAESLQLQISVLHQSKVSLQGCSLKFIWWLAKCKEIVPNVLDPNQDVQKHATPNSSLHKLKIYSSKGCRKTSQRWIICM